VISPNGFLLFLWFAQTQERGIRFALQAFKRTKTQKQPNHVNSLQSLKLKAVERLTASFPCDEPSAIGDELLY
jgi:hypothetical protein